MREIIIKKLKEIEHSENITIKEIPRITPLNEFIERNLSLIRVQIEALPKEVAGSWEPLNDLFLSVLESTNHFSL